MQMYYTGVGSRDTPTPIQNKMIELAEQLTDLGLRLRSGHARGADLAFEEGSNNHCDIYIPFKNFNNKYNYTGNTIVLTDLSQSHQNKLQVQLRRALEDSISERHLQHILRHRIHKLFHTRNVLQVLGHNPDVFIPSRFVLFYAPPLTSTKWKGGTNTAIQIARLYRVPYFNLWDLDWSRLQDFIQKSIS